MKQKIIGTYQIGHSEVQLVLREGTGGEFYTVPGDIHFPRIKVGADSKDWNQLVSVLIHEALELICESKECRYDRPGDLSNDHSAYIFVLNHTQFSDACARLAMFLVAALPDLARAWRKWK